MTKGHFHTFSNARRRAGESVPNTTQNGTIALKRVILLYTIKERRVKMQWTYHFECEMNILQSGRWQIRWGETGSNSYFLWEYEEFVGKFSRPERAITHVMEMNKKMVQPT